MRKIFTNGEDCVVAETPEQGILLLCVHYGITLEEYLAESGGMLVPMDADYTHRMSFDGPRDLYHMLKEALHAGCSLAEAMVEGPGGAAQRAGLYYTTGIWGDSILAPASWWSKMDFGFLCSTEG